MHCHKWRVVLHITSSSTEEGGMAFRDVVDELVDSVMLINKLKRKGAFGNLCRIQKTI
jgi:hypothetical protein